MALSTTQGQTLQRVGLYPSSLVFFLMTGAMWHYPDLLHLTAPLLQLVKRN